jgi:hypothetical protein
MKTLRQFLEDYYKIPGLKPMPQDKELPKPKEKTPDWVKRQIGRNPRKPSDPFFYQGK